jgi:hypothetical protein
MTWLANDFKEERKWMQREQKQELLKQSQEESCEWAMSLQKSCF